MDSGKSAKPNAGLIGSSEDHAIKTDCGRKQAEMYVRDEGPRFHPIFSVTTSLDDQRVQLKPDWSAPLRSQTDQFYEVIEIYQDRITKDNILPPKFAIRGKHTWDEVFQAAKDASDQSKNTRGFKRWMKNLGRSTTETASHVKPFLELIPNGDYTGALCGGLKLAFGVAARMKEKREAILDAFETLPQTIQKVQDCRARHPNDHALYDAAIDLYLTILDAVMHMIIWLVGVSAWKRYWSNLSDSLAEKPIEVGLLEVQQKSEKLLYRAEKLESDATVETNLLAKTIQSDVKHTSATLQALQVNANRVDVSTQNIEHKTDAIYPLANNTYELVTGIVEKLNVTQKAQLENAGLASSGLQGFIQDQIKSALWKNKRQKYKKDRQELKLEREKVRLEQRAVLEEKRAVLETQIQLSQAQAEFFRQRAQKLGSQRPLDPAQSAFTLDHLRTLLDVPPERDARDLEHISQKGKNGTSSSHAQSYWLLSHSKFRAWLNSNESHSLLVEGNDSSSERISPTSFVCATLIHCLKETQQVTPIAFFCSLHTGEGVSLRGPQGLMRSLIHQLLPVQDFDLGFINDSYAERVRLQDLLWLCDLFVRLVDQLSEDRVLFCLIDSVSAFERQKYGNGVFQVMDKLSMLTRTLGSAPIFKLLLATGRVSKQMRNHFSPDDCITVKGDSEDGRVLTGNYLKRHTRQLFDAQNKLPATISQDEPAPEGTQEEGSSLLPDITSESDEEH